MTFELMDCLTYYRYVPF